MAFEPFFDFGPPFDFYEIFLASAASGGARSIQQPPARHAVLRWKAAELTIRSLLVCSFSQQ
jgi:hypothetical protein